MVAFPPRNEPNAFYQDLQVLYRDYLKRSQTALSYVDPEGENVWLTECFRFYLNGSSHQEAMSRRIAEIRSGTTSPVCGGETLVFPPRNLPYAFQAQLESTYHESLGRLQPTSTTRSVIAGGVGLTADLRDLEDATVARLGERSPQIGAEIGRATGTTSRSRSLRRARPRWPTRGSWTSPPRARARAPGRS